MKARIGIETSEIEFLRWIDDYSHQESLTYDYQMGSYQTDFRDSQKKLVARAVCNQETGQISLIKGLR